MSSIPSLTQALTQAAIFGEKRHEVLAGNVANIDTPTYRTRDLNVSGFQETLQQMIDLRRNPETAPIASPTSPEVSLPQQQIDLAPRIAESHNITFQDANNRSVEQEMTELSKNAMRQTFLIQVLTAQMSQIESVISGRI